MKGTLFIHVFLTLCIYDKLMCLDILLGKATSVTRALLFYERYGLQTPVIIFMANIK